LRGVRTINEIGQEFSAYTGAGEPVKAGTLFEGKRGPQPVAAHSAPERLYSKNRAPENGAGLAQKKAGMSLP
jgi:hypothetical protein